MNTSETTRTRNTYLSYTLLPALLALAALLGAAPAVVADCECESPWVIGSYESCVLDENCEVEWLIILPGGRLYTASYTLTITGYGGLIMFANSWLLVQDGGTVVLTGGGTSYVDGRIVLEASTSDFRIADNDHTISPIGVDGGYITGQDNSAEIAIDSGLTLTSNITIEGALQVHAASATFVNGATGLVHANRTTGGQVLTLHSGTFDDVDGAEWKVSAHATAELYLRSGITVNALDGDFTVSNGTLDLDVSATTDGDLTFTGGQIEVAPGTTFQAG